MSPNTSSNSDSNAHSPDEWVEIVEPKSKQKIYANLETGICARKPPDGAIVSRSEDITDHWWELYDEKTGKYYYYNPEQQKTAWTRPKESPATNGNGGRRKLLIIPVSKLQAQRRNAPHELVIEKRDVSTQTIASNMVSTGTQTISEISLQEELKDKLRLVDIPNTNVGPTSCTHLNSGSNSNRSYLNHRQLSDFNGRDRSTFVRSHQSHQSFAENKQRKYQNSETSLTEQSKSSHNGPVRNDQEENTRETDDGTFISYFGHSSSHARERAPISIQSPSKLSYSRKDDYLPSTSTFGNPARPPAGSQKQPKQVTTNNLSHYLVREARAMGIALISDDELDDDDRDSEGEWAVEEDDDTDLRDDTSSHHGASDLNASQELGENSSDGWKSFSDHGSPNSITQKSNQSVKKSPIHCETSPTTFSYGNLIDDEKDPASCMSQQLDHRKLVENFKKSRQTSSFGLHDTLSRSYRLDANQAVQRIKTVADTYFNQDKEQLSESHLRQLSTLTTLPRPHKQAKDKAALSKQNDISGENLDADYDVVEDNCSFYRDSKSLQPNQFNFSSEVASKVLTKAHSTAEPQSPSSYFDRNKSSRGSTFSVESFARENLTRHPKKGGLLFNRKVKWSRMITWTNNPIKQPMISSVSSDLNADSIASFKLIQQFMGDRKLTLTKKYRQIAAESGINLDDYKESLSKGKNLVRSGSMNAGHGTSGVTNSPSIPDRLRDELAYELVVKGCTKSNLRDEIYVQMARQLTENPSQSSTSWGLILMSILLSYFSPSSKFSPFLLSFLETHSHQMARDVCQPRLEKRLRQNWLTYCRKPADGKEISIVRLSITKWPQYCGVFGESLERIMSLQTCSPYLKTLRLPWILTTLGDKLLETGGAETEGIFRCAADHDLIAQLRLEIDCVDFRKITDAQQVHSLLSNVQDPHVIAGLLKPFFRHLSEPIFPTHLYDTCLQSGHDGQLACRVFTERLPNLNKDVVAYLIRLLQMLTEPANVVRTKMDSSNLSMVWAPNLLRAPQQQQELNLASQGGSKMGSKWSIANGEDHQQGQQTHEQPSVVTSQSMIFEQTRQEMQFIRALIVHLDTTFIENVV